MVRVLERLPKFSDPNLLVGGEKMDDAGVYKINEEIAIVQTLDFFTPMVDDPYLFGQIAAVNALNDIYAMGAKPLTVMNIVCFPECMDAEVLAQILLGGASKIKEAGAILIGGHTVDDNEPKYGLAVTGLIHPDKVITNAGARPNQDLILTKPIGTGIISTAVKGKVAEQGLIDYATTLMSTLNDFAAAEMVKSSAAACTDITGFGLLGHAMEMAEASRVSITINLPSVPIIKGVFDLANMGIVPAGARVNLKYVEQKIAWKGQVSDIYKDILADPQTAGGLLIAVAKENSSSLIDNLKARHIIASKIGYTEDYNGNFITVEGF